MNVDEQARPAQIATGPGINDLAVRAFYSKGRAEMPDLIHVYKWLNVTKTI
jgi:hypothetical protein